MTVPDDLETLVQVFCTGLEKNLAPRLDLQFNDEIGCYLRLIFVLHLFYLSLPSHFEATEIILYESITTFFIDSYMSLMLLL